MILEVCLKVWHLMQMPFPSLTVPHRHPSYRPLMPMHSICNACLQQPFLRSPMTLPAILCLPYISSEMLPMMPSSINSLASLVRDSDDQEILSPHCHAPSLPSNSDDDDVSEHGMPSPQAIWALPPCTAQLMLPNHISLTFPRCTPSMPATSQESPEVCSMICEVTFDDTCFR